MWRSEESANRIRDFCSICDFYKRDGTCREREISGEQERKVKNNWCGYGRLNGQRVFITKDYIILENKEYLRESLQFLKNFL